MTLRGAIRSIAAAQRRAAREEERRQRHLMRLAKIQAKVNELESAAAEVEEYAERVAQLTSIHHTVGDAVNWQEMVAAPAPISPVNPHRHETAARHALETFRPGFWQRLFKTAEKRHAQLVAALDTARQRDETEHAQDMRRHQVRMEDWSEKHALADAILRGDIDAYRHAITELAPLAEVTDMGCTLEVQNPDARTIEVVLTVESETVVPREVKSLTKTGKLSSKNLPQGKFQELYQDYVCGCVLRTAREFFSFLPINRVVVNVEAALLDPSTGHIRSQTILSVGMPRATIESLNFPALDPSDAMRHFIHRMGFKRSQGFHAVRPLVASEYPN